MVQLDDSMIGNYTCLGTPIISSVNAIDRLPSLRVTRYEERKSK